MEKINHLVELKDYYKQPKNKISLLDVPKWNFLMIDGQKDPNENPAYAESVAALYAVAYTLKFMVKKGGMEIDYKVMPLEGLWWAEDMAAFTLDHRENWLWTMMIMQPDFITQEMFEQALQKSKSKKDIGKLDSIRFGPFQEGPAMQIFHQGPYGEGESENIEKLHAHITSQGYILSGKHHEIYFNSPLRTAPENLKIIIRQPVAKISK